MTYCFSVTDETDGTYCRFSHAYPFSEIQVATDKYGIKTPAGNMTGDLDDMHLTTRSIMPTTPCGPSHRYEPPMQCVQ